MIVVDASVVLEVLLRTPIGSKLEERLFGIRQTLHAPHLLDVEVTQVIRRYAASKAIDAARGTAALQDFVDLPIQRYAHGIFLPRVWSLRQDYTAYDATYVALAEALDAPLITRDRRLANGAGHTARIEVM